MKRELCKFFAGAFAALAYGHAMYAVGVSRGMITEPIFLGRRWGVGYMWTEAVAYSGVSLGLAYCGWFRKPREELQVSGAAVTTLGEQPEIIH